MTKFSILMSGIACPQMFFNLVFFVQFVAQHFTHTIYKLVQCVCVFNIIFSVSNEYECVLAMSKCQRRKHVKCHIYSLKGFNSACFVLRPFMTFFSHSLEFFKFRTGALFSCFQKFE